MAAFSNKKLKMLSDFTNTKTELRQLESDTDRESSEEEDLVDHELRLRQFLKKV